MAASIGFSDKELQKILASSEDTTGPSKPRAKKTLQAKPSGRSQKLGLKPASRPSSQPSESAKSDQAPLPSKPPTPTAKTTAKPEEQAAHTAPPASQPASQPDQAPVSPSKVIAEQAPPATDAVATTHSESSSPVKEVAKDVVKEVDIRVMSPEEERKQQELTWQLVEKRKREMEESNKKRKQLLTGLIASRQSKAVSEARKLQQIQHELAQLDKGLSFDIGMLRGRIEDAARSFEHARKRFDAAELEYVQAKLQLQRTQELKDQLTEHLMVIIQKNEERKADKLNDLMNQLNIVNDCDETGLLSQVVEQPAADQSQIHEASVAVVPDKQADPSPDVNVQAQANTAAQCEVAAGLIQKAISGTQSGSTHR